MSEMKQGKQNSEIKEIDKMCKENKKEKEENENINPISLLSKDLLDKINSLEEIDFDDFGEKKGKASFYTHLDETQKESDDNEEDNDCTLDIDKDIFGYEIFKKDENEKSFYNKDFSKQQGRFSQPMSCLQQIANFNLNQFDDSFLYSTLGRFSYNCPQYQNKKESINQIINSPYHNQLNFFNNSFTMNGKSGWVCSHCKNFNYECKF